MFFASIFRLIHIINILPVDNFGTQIELCRTAFSAYMAITSYTLLYQLLALRHKLVSKTSVVAQAHFVKFEGEFL